MLHCETCKRSYHERCLKPPRTQFIHNGAFFCEVCIGRKWHQEAPPLSSPSSPQPERARTPLPGYKPDIPRLTAGSHLSSSTRTILPTTTFTDQVLADRLPEVSSLPQPSEAPIQPASQRKHTMFQYRDFVGSNSVGDWNRRLACWFRLPRY